MNVQNISSLPGDFNNQSKITVDGIWKAQSHSSEIRLHPNGQFLYVGNRGHDSICQFEISVIGTLRYVTTVPSGGKTPRNFNFNQAGTKMLVANQDSDCCTSFGVDTKTGSLEFIESIPASSPNYVVAVN